MRGTSRLGSRRSRRPLSGSTVDEQNTSKTPVSPRINDDMVSRQNLPVAYVFESVVAAREAGWIPACTGTVVVSRLAACLSGQ